jgi:CHAT domain-containing protein
LILHFSTHGFGNLQFQFDLPDLSQEFSKSGLVLAGFNTYMSSKFDRIDPVASTGMLTSLSVYGINLTNTRLVFLSTCVSGVGATHLQESTNSIASAFRSAGALTVIATTWRIDDKAAAEFVKYFYNSLCVPNTRPSEALNNACEEMCKNPDFSSWYYWAGFTCYGDDIPVFSTTTNT